jgi:hypothetical protein
MILTFPPSPRRLPLQEAQRMERVKHFRDRLPDHRHGWFDSLSDADQARMAGEFELILEGRL